MVGMKFRRAIGVVAAAFCLLISLNAAAQRFPRLQEENLNGQPVVLPDAASGKVAVLIFGFSRASQKATESWMKRLQTDFGKASGLELYQLPVLEAAPRFVRGMIVSGIRKGVPENQRANFVPVMHQEDELKKLVGYKQEDDAYVVVLDRSGKVAFQAHGASADAGYAEFRPRLDSVLK
jgi:ATP10 protein